MASPLPLDLPPWMKKHVKPSNSNLSGASKNCPQLPVIRPEPPLPVKPTSADTLECSQFWQIAEFAERLLLKAEKEEFMIGLDLDWPAAYKSFLGKTSYIHICYDKNKCCSLKVFNTKVLPKALTLLLAHANVKFAGYNLYEDVNKLGKDFNFDVKPLLEKINNPGSLPADNIYCIHNWDLESASQKRELSPDAEEAPLVTGAPLFRFTGKLKYSNYLSTCGAAAEELLELAENYSRDKKLILGFDLEWPYSFQAGSGKVALVQICPDEHQCYILHIPTLKSLPRTLVLLLNHKNIKLVGVNIANDIRKIGRDYNIETKYILENNLVELGTLANQVLNISERWSLARLVLHMLGKELEKPVNVRCSNWAQDKLSGQQLVYAASDAYAGLAVYNHLMKIKEGKSQGDI